MTQSFRILNEQLSERIRRSPREYRRLLDQAWRWKPMDGQDDLVWEKAILYDAPHNADWVRAVLRLSQVAPRSGPPYGPQVVSPWESTPVNAVRALELADGENSRRMTGLIQAARIALLKTTKDRLVARATSWSIQPTPARFTAVLALSEWALDKERLSPNSRLEFAAEICRLMPDGAPIDSSGPRPEAGSAEETQALLRFEEWLNSNRPGWRKNAARELPGLKRLAAELGVAIR